MAFYKKMYSSEAKADPVEDLEFEKEWRQVTWSNEERDKMLKKLDDYKTILKDSILRILLHGPVGAGKSAFINSAQTSLRGRIYSGALSSSTLTESGDTFTVKYKTYKLKKKEGAFFPFVISDIMGIEKAESKGIHNDDILKVLQGKIKDGYNFSPVTSITEEDRHYNNKPTLDDKVHCLVFVLPANNISLIDEDVFRKMRYARNKARDLDIPQVVVMTKVDDVCPLVKKDLKKVYTSKTIKEKMEKCKCKLGIPMNCIFPVKNYSEEIDTNTETDILNLTALTHIVTFANDFVEEQTEGKN